MTTVGSDLAQSSPLALSLWFTIAASTHGRIPGRIRNFVFNSLFGRADIVHRIDREVVPVGNGVREKETVVMIRSRLAKSVFGCLAWAGLAAGQVPAPTVSPAPERYLTIQTTGKQPQKCKII